VDSRSMRNRSHAWAFLRLNGLDLPDVYDVDFAEQLVVTAALGEID
jgi:hypothetical protein